MATTTNVGDCLLDKNELKNEVINSNIVANIQQSPKTMDGYVAISKNDDCNVQVYKAPSPHSSTSRQLDRQPMKEMEEEKYENMNNLKLCSVPKRFILVFMGFLGYNILYMLRVNLSVAIVSMVDSDSPANNNNNNDTNPTNNNSFQFNYSIDHQTIEPIDLGEKFVWNEKVQALVLSSFFAGYVITQYPGGRLADMFGSKWLFGLGIMFTSILTIISPFAARSHYYMFIGCRVLEGLFEGLAFPSMHSMIAKWIPIYERSRMATFMYSGSQIGTVITMPVAALLCDSKFTGGWPSVFYIMGSFGLLWCFVWFWAIYETPEQHPTISQRELHLIIAGRHNDLNKKKPKLPWPAIIKSVPLWALIVAHSGQNWGFYTFLTQLPRYFKTVLGFDIKKNGLFSSLPYLCQALVGCTAGYICDKLYTRNLFTLSQLRKTFNTVAFLGPTICLLLLTKIGAENSTWCIILFTTALGINGCCLAGFQVTHVDLSPTFASSLMGITNCIANLTGILAPYVVGVILTNAQKSASSSSSDYQNGDRNAAAADANILGWNYVFYVSCFIYVISAFIFLIFGSNERQPWDGGVDDNQHHDHVDDDDDGHA